MYNGGQDLETLPGAYAVRAVPKPAALWLPNAWSAARRTRVRAARSSDRQAESAAATSLACARASRALQNQSAAVLSLGTLRYLYPHR